MTYTIKFDNSELDKYINNLHPKLKVAIDSGLNKTTVFGLRKTKESLPKRSGTLRNSYQKQRNSAMWYQIFSPLQYAYNLEFGSKAKTIVPKRKKMLTIPIKKEVLTSGGQIKKSALDRLFTRLKNKKKQTAWEIFNDVGIVLSKKAKIPKIEGKFTLKKVVVPSIRFELEKNVNAAIRGAL